jgi:hypothetical protein
MARMVFTVDLDVADAVNPDAVKAELELRLEASLSSQPGDGYILNIRQVYCQSTE